VSRVGGRCCPTGISNAVGSPRAVQIVSKNLVSLIHRSLRLGRSPASRDPYRWLSWLGLIFLVCLAVALRHAVGLTLDETLHMRYGRKILLWFSSGFADRRALSFGGIVAQYGGLFDAVVQLAARFTPNDALATRHVGSALCAVLGIVATWKIAERLGGTRAGFLAACMLALTPTWVGHGLFNPKDIPFAAAAAWTVYGMLRFATDPAMPSWRMSIACGVALGTALGVRPGGMFLIGYPVLALFARQALEPCPPLRAAGWKHALGSLALCGGVAWACMLVAWPWAQVSPIVRPFLGAWDVAHSEWVGRMLFAGSFIDSQHLPRGYLPTWFAITLPESYLMALVCGVIATGLAWKARQLSLRAALGPACVAFALLAPFAAALLLQPPLYDAHRHFLFLLPPMAALAGYALSAFFERTELRMPVRAAVGGMLIGLFAVVASDMWRVHPYEYVYFNRLSGGLPGEAPRFETDYWGAAYGEALDWVGEQLTQNPNSAMRIGSCNHDDAVRRFLARHPEFAPRVKLEPRSGDADIFLATTRYNCHKTAGQVVHVVERMGVPLLYVIQRRAIAAAPRSEASASAEGS
jgi:hypothetical protein